MFRCLYCNQDKVSGESSLEHGVPQFLGGAHAPDHYKLRNVCQKCNSALGLHVDGSYARSWTVTNGLALANRKLYTGPGQEPPLPLACMGILASLPGLVVPENMVVELWVGPSGESIVWIRAGSEDKFWYMGGHPIDEKRKPSTVYYLPTVTDPVGFQMGVEAFFGAFKEAKKTKRILGADLVGPGATPGMTYPGFDAKTSEEKANVDAIHQAIAACHGNKANWIKAQSRHFTSFDDRFICKMLLAVGYSLFGDPFLTSPTVPEALNGLWPKKNPPSKLKGSRDPGNLRNIAPVTGYPGAVAIVVMRVENKYMLLMSIDQQLPFAVELAPVSFNSKLVDPYDGYVLLLFPQLRKSVELSLVDLVCHSLNQKAHPELVKIDAVATQAKAFDASLPRLPVPTV